MIAANAAADFFFDYYHFCRFRYCATTPAAMLCCAFMRAFAVSYALRVAIAAAMIDITMRDTDKMLILRMLILISMLVAFAFRC